MITNKIIASKNELVYWGGDNKVEAQKQKIQKEYDEAMEALNEVAQKLQKIKNIEVMRCSDKQ